MFKKTKIAAATIALLGAAAAQNVSAVAIDDTGSSAQVLVYPYYNVNNGFQTSIGFRNTKNETKAVKVRFRESKASNDVLDFNVYMSPYDNFSVTLTKTADGNVLLRTADTTCTYPAIPSAGVIFQNVYTNTSAADSREGYVEVIEMGVVDPLATVTINGVSKKIVDGIKHTKTSGVVKPVDCSYVATAWDTGVFTQGGALADAHFTDTAKTVGGYYSDEGTGSDGIPNSIYTPTGGIQGYSILLNVQVGAVFVGDPVAIRNYQTTLSTTVLTPNHGAQHYRSDDQTFYLLPSLASGNVTTTEGLTSSAATTPTGYVHTWSSVVADWGLSDPNLAPNTSVPSGVNPFPIADALAVTGVHNDYFINPSFNAATDWVITLPMKKHGIFNGYRFDNVAKSTADSTHPVNLFKANSSSTVDVTFASKFYDREEQVPVQNVGFSPAVQGQLGVLDREVNILTFTNTDNATTPVLGTDSPKKFSIESGFVEGWARLTFSNVNLKTGIADSVAKATTTSPTITTDVTPWATVTGTGTPSYVGVPALGFAAIRGNFGAAAGDVVGETTRHVFERSR